MSAAACPVGPKRWKKTPKMKPGFTTAYDAIKWAYDTVKEEQRRLHMGDWVYVFGGRTRYGEPIKRSQLNDFLPTSRRNRIPECGTVACFAGWIGIGIGMKPTEIVGTSVLKALGFSIDYFGSAREGTGKELSKIFYSTALTPKYVLKEVKAFLATHEAELKAMKVEVV